MRMGELGIAIVNANDEMGSRKWYSVADVLGKIDLSDDECFYDNYIDRESENDLHDDEPPSDADSNATEDYTPPAAAAAADAGHISHPDSEHGDGDAAIPATHNLHQHSLLMFWNVLMAVMYQKWIFTTAEQLLSDCRWLQWFATRGSESRVLPINSPSANVLK